MSVARSVARSVVTAVSKSVATTVATTVARSIGTAVITVVIANYWNGLPRDTYEHQQQQHNLAKAPATPVSMLVATLT